MPRMLPYDVLEATVKQHAFPWAHVPKEPAYQAAEQIGKALAGIKLDTEELDDVLKLIKANMQRIPLWAKEIKTPDDMLKKIVQWEDRGLLKAA